MRNAVPNDVKTRSREAGNITTECAFFQSVIDYPTVC